LNKYHQISLFSIVSQIKWRIDQSILHFEKQIFDFRSLFQMAHYQHRNKLISHLPKSNPILLDQGIEEDHPIECKNCEEISQVRLCRSNDNQLYYHPILATYQCPKCHVNNTISAYPDGRIAQIK